MVIKYKPYHRNLLSNPISMLLAEREVARDNNNYELADYIRDELAKLDIEVTDTTDGTDWEFAYVAVKRRKEKRLERIFDGMLETCRNVRT